MVQDEEMMSHLPPATQREWQNPGWAQGRPGGRVPVLPCCAGPGAVVASLSHCDAEAAETFCKNGRGHVPIKLCVEKPATGWIWPVKCSWPISF